MSSISHSVLLVEDDDLVRDLLDSSLRYRGYRVAQAVDGLDALDRVAHETFDLIVTDIGMPRLDGVAFLERKTERGDRTPAVVLTAYADLLPEAMCERLGVVACIQKPVLTSALLDAVATALAAVSRAPSQTPS